MSSPTSSQRMGVTSCPRPQETCTSPGPMPQTWATTLVWLPATWTSPPRASSANSHSSTWLLKVGIRGNGGLEGSVGFGKWYPTMPKNCGSERSERMRSCCQVSHPCPRPPQERECLEICELWEVWALMQSTSLESFVCDSHNLSLSPDPRLFAPSIKARFPPETYALVGQQVTLECFAFGK